MDQSDINTRIAALAKGVFPGEAPAAPTATAEPPATNAEAPAPAPGGPARDDKGRFTEKGGEPPAAEAKPKSDIVQMREILKEMRKENKALQAELAAMKTATSSTPTATGKPDRVSEIVKAMPKETQDWYAQHGEELIGLLAKSKAEETLNPYLPALKAAEAHQRSLAEQSQIDRAFQEWSTDKMLDGEVVDRRAVLEAVVALEEEGVSFRDPIRAFDYALGIVKAKGGASIPVVNEEEAKARAAAEAAAKVAGGSVRPGSSQAPPPVDVSAEFSKELRMAGLTGNHPAKDDLLRKRIAALGILPSQKAPRT